MCEKLSKEFFEKNAEIVARDLLGKILCRKIIDSSGNIKILKSKIVETEAYFGSEDPASRACKNGDLRETMLMEGGRILVYGVHNNWLINFVTGKKGKAEAVLLRALEPLNFDEAYRCNGPGLLTRALKIDKNFHKKDILNNDNIWIEDSDEYNNREKKEKFKIISKFRIGIKNDLNKPFRFYIKDNKFISRQ